MPIKPENRKRYPANWVVITAKMMARAGNRCEWPDCGLGHGWVGYRDDEDRFVVLSRDGKVSDVADLNGKYAGHKVIRIVLTCAHLDHTPENCDPDNLRMWCQRHHLRYDLGHHRQTAHATRKANAFTYELFPSDEMNCPRCQVPMRRGVFIRQTVNRLRPGQTVGTLYPCGPGALATCLKCPRCGHSIETTTEKGTNA